VPVVPVEEHPAVTAKRTSRAAHAESAAIRYQDFIVHSLPDVILKDISGSTFFPELAGCLRECSARIFRKWQKPSRETSGWSGGRVAGKKLKKKRLTALSKTQRPMPGLY
jgi:hypothetical protein